MPRVAIGMWGGTFGAEGRIALWDMDERNWLSPPRLDLTLLGTGIQIERLIGGSNLATGALTFRAHARGPTNDVALEVDFSDAGGVTVLGERVRLPAHASLRVGDDGVALADFPLGGPGSSVLIVAGRIALSGRLALDVGIRQFPIGHLPGILGTSLPVAGSVSGSVRIVGEARLPALTGELTLADVSYAGHASRRWHDQHHARGERRGPRTRQADRHDRGRRAPRDQAVGVRGRRDADARQAAARTFSAEAAGKARRPRRRLRDRGRAHRSPIGPRPRRAG